MRVGYATRGVVYGVLGGIALAVASAGGDAAGLLGSLRRIGELPGHTVYLLIIALGLVGYSIWRGLDAILNLAGHNERFTGWVVRGGLFFIAALHLAWAWYASKYAFSGSGGGAEGGDGRIGDFLVGLMKQPAGRWFVILIGLGALSFGFYSIQKGVRFQFFDHMRRTKILQALSPIFAFGLVVRGAVLAVMGGYIIWAGWAFKPQAAGGYGHALKEIKIFEAWQGHVMLGVVGVGLIAFAAYCFGESVYRVIPRYV